MLLGYTAPGPPNPLLPLGTLTTMVMSEGTALAPNYRDRLARQDPYLAMCFPDTDSIPNRRYQASEGSGSFLQLQPSQAGPRPLWPCQAGTYLQLWQWLHRQETMIVLGSNSKIQHKV